MYGQYLALAVVNQSINRILLEWCKAFVIYIYGQTYRRKSKFSRFCGHKTKHPCTDRSKI